MKKIFQNLIDEGLLKEEEIGRPFVNKVIAKARGDLKSAEILFKNSREENAFELAYESMLSSGRALAFSYGLRPRSQGSHRITLEFARLAMDESAANLLKRFSRMRKTRHYLIYGAGLSISMTEAENALKNAREFLKRTEEDMRKRDPQRQMFL